MLPLGLGRNSAGLLRALRTPIPRSPGLPEAAGSGVLSGWRNLRRKPCRIRLCRHFSRRAWAHSSAHFFAALRGAKPESFVARQSRRVAALASAADAGRAHGRRLGLRGVRLRSTAGGKGCASFFCRACRARIPAHRRAFACGRGKRLSRRCSGGLERRRFAAERSPDFPAFPAGWRKRMRRGKR